jgi:hypothetical protein
MTTHETDHPEDDTDTDVVDADEVGDDEPDDLELDPTDEDDDESVLLTETEPGSVLPPEGETDEPGEPDDEEVGYFERTDANSGQVLNDIETTDEADLAEAPQPFDQPEVADVPETETETDEAATTDFGETADVPETVGAAEVPETVGAAEVPETVGAAVAAEEAVEPSPMERLEPVGPNSPVDPGTGSYEDRWTAIQASFIDDPRRAVESASALVAQLWEEIEHSIAVQRQGLEEGWQASDRTTDDLRVAMQEYRALYTRFVDFTPGPLGV